MTRILCRRLLLPKTKRTKKRTSGHDQKKKEREYDQKPMSNVGLSSSKKKKESCVEVTRVIELQLEV
jgi:hypothetical protein